MLFTSRARYFRHGNPALRSPGLDRGEFDDGPAMAAFADDAAIVVRPDLEEMKLAVMPEIARMAAQLRTHPRRSEMAKLDADADRYLARREQRLQQRS